MTWSALQSNVGSSSGVTTKSVAFTTANVSSGTKLIAYLALLGGATVTSVKDGAGNAFTQQSVASFSGRVQQTWSLDTPAGDAGTKPTVTAIFSSSDVSMVIQEVSGLLTGASCTDGTAGTTSGSATGSVGPPAYASAVPGEFLTYLYGDDGDAATITGPAGYTTDASQVNSTSSFPCLLVAYKDSTGGTEAGQYSVSGGGGNLWGLTLVAFQLAPSGTDSGPNSPSTGTDLGGGTGSWSSPGNITADDGSAATWAVV